MRTRDRAGRPPPVLQAVRRRSTGRPSVAAVKAAEAAEGQVVTAAMLGHKCDLAVMALHPDWRVLRALQTRAAGRRARRRRQLRQHHRGQRVRQGDARAHAARRACTRSLPPEGKPVFCFYPMTKRREAHANWYATPFDERDAMMREHGKSGRTFAGKVVQLITGSTGLDDYEWGVTLFAISARGRQGRRVHDALRQGLGAVRRVRPLLRRLPRVRRRGASDGMARCRTGVALTRSTISNVRHRLVASVAGRTRTRRSGPAPGRRFGRRSRVPAAPS